MESSTHIYLPKITCRNIALKIIAFESLTFWWKQPMLFVPDENHVIIQPLFIVLIVETPFVSELIERLCTPPLFADFCHSWVIIFHPYKRATGIRSRIRLTTKVLDNSFTSAVSGRGHVERTSLLFTVESQLSKGHIRSEFFLSPSAKNNVPSLVKANFIVGPLEGGLNRWGVLNNVGNEKPPPWKPKRFCLLSRWFYSIIHLFLYFYLFFCILNMNNGNDEIFFSNSVEMAIFKIKIGLWKNTFFQFGEISGYFVPSIQHL